MAAKELSIRKKFELSLKYYQEHTFTELLNDITPFKATGIDNQIFKAIDQILEQALEIAQRVKDGGLLKRYFHEDMKIFKEAFKNWHDAKIGEPKEKAWSNLRRKNRRMFRRFLNDMEKLEKNKELHSTTVKEFKKIADIHLKGLHSSLADLCLKKYLGAFPLLTEALTNFQKENL